MVWEMRAEAGTLQTLGALRVCLSDHAKSYEDRKQAILCKYQNWAITETLTSATGLYAQQVTNADSSMNDIKNKELNDAPDSWRVVMTVIRNEKWLPQYVVSSQASTCFCHCLELKTCWNKQLRMKATQHWEKVSWNVQSWLRGDACSNAGSETCLRIFYWKGFQLIFTMLFLC